MAEMALYSYTAYTIGLTLWNVYGGADIIHYITTSTFVIENIYMMDKRRYCGWPKCTMVVYIIIIVIIIIRIFKSIT